MIGYLRTPVRKQPIIALYFKFETVLKLYYTSGTQYVKQINRKFLYIWALCLCSQKELLLTGQLSHRVGDNQKRQYY